MNRQSDPDPGSTRLSIQCVACNQVADATVHTHLGWICKRCQLSATSVTKTYVIGGQIYIENLKGTPPALLQLVKSDMEKGH